MQQIKAMKRKTGNPWGSGVIHDPSGTEILRGWGGGGLIGRTIRGGEGLDIFWNHTINLPSEFLLT